MRLLPPAAALLLCLTAAGAVAEPKNLSGYQVVRVKTEEDGDGGNATATSVLDSLDNIFDAVLKRADVWQKYPEKGEADILISPSERAKLEAAGKKLIKILINNVGKLAEKERRPAAAVDPNEDFGNQRLPFDRYHDLDDIYEYIDYLEETYPDDVSSEVIGKTFEGRDIKVVKICKGGCGRRHIVFVESGIHAREWVAPASASYLLYRLAEGLGGGALPDDDACMMTRNFDWHVIVVANPDGYVYSRKSDRMWRKTREPVNSNWTDGFQGNFELSYCGISDLTGTDGNRNFDMHWGEHASKFACADDFKGAYPFSSPVSKAIADYVTLHKSRIAFYGALHAYSQIVLVPFGIPDMEDSPITKRSKRLAEKGSKAMKEQYGKKYAVMPAVDIGYASSGCSMDWAVTKAGIPYGSTIELRPSVEDGYGFMLPPDQILPTCKESFAFFKAVAEELFQEFGYPTDKGYVVVGSSDSPTASAYINLALSFLTSIIASAR